MTNVLKTLLLGSMLAVSTLAGSLAQAREVKVAVSDLAYEERVQEYFREIKSSSKSSLRASAAERANTRSASARRSVNAQHESNFSYSEGTYSYIDRGELRKFTADIKGEMLKSGYFRIVQGKPFTATNKEKLYDIIARIKSGQYPGADYVLFGTLSSIQFRQEANPLDNTDTVSHSLSLELVGDFSLVNTKTYEVKGSFSAIGEGQDTKLVSSAGANVVFNRGKVISEVSKSLGEDVIRQLEEQLASLEGYAPSVRTNSIREERREEVIHFH
ncbi:MAG: penicillin-binding protein activator LpoB [Azoarcus sp.]|jgi:alkylated DNA nucleotide flippase Atl1|nr:penicillin-binding protein activator LpoB [Azoarcus sp.]